MNWRIFNWLPASFILATVALAEAQQANRMPRIGYVSETGEFSAPSTNLEALRQGLREFGHSEGKNVVIEFRFAAGKPERVSTLVAQLAQLNVDVFSFQPTAGIRAAKQATKTTVSSNQNAVSSKKV